MTGSAVLQVKGSLRRNISFWHDIGAPEFILSIIQDGYRLPFETIPSGNVLNNNMSSLHYPKFVEERILELLHTYRVVEVQALPYVVNPPSVSVQPNGKKRLILDLRYVNKHFIKQRVKYEDWKVALSYFQKGAFMISFDLKSGYHHIDIYPDHQTFLGFAWKFSGDTKFRCFVFTVLPYGLVSAPFIFTKCLKPLEKFWRIHGISVAIFLDDGWLIDSHQVSCAALAVCVRSDLYKAGFITNDEKSHWTPSQVIEWLGIVWDSSHGTIRISDRQLFSIADCVQKISQKHFKVSARELASLVGKIISAGAVFGNISRYCSISVAAAQDWDSKFTLDQYCVREIEFWETNLDRLSLKSIIDSPFRPSKYVVYSDASATQCGVHLNVNGEQICHKQWDVHECGMSSTWRELTAIVFTLESFLPLLKGSYIKWFSDSQNACRIIQVGSMRKGLHVIALKIFHFCVDNGIELEMQWIPRTKLDRADFISRIIDVDDWQIKTSFFEFLDYIWGPHTVDCFANFYNTKVKKFYSRVWNPGCSGVDFFVQNLTGENCLVVPPINLIHRTIHYLYTSKAVATLVVPFWPSSYF